MAAGGTEMGRPVVHWELWSKEPARLGDFYAQVFDWQVQEIPELRYHTVATGVDGKVDGGMFRPQDGPWPGNMTLYVQVDELAPSLERVVTAGGSIVVERQEVPGMGVFALFADPDGRVMGLWQRAS
jgi:predicted enzyme related to lactoylglutathione lyase